MRVKLKKLLSYDLEIIQNLKKPIELDKFESNNNKVLYSTNIQTNQNLQTNNLTLENVINFPTKALIKSCFENIAPKNTQRASSKYSNEASNNVKKINWIKRQDTFLQKSKMPDKDFEIFKLADLRSNDEEFQNKIISSGK